jgi:hypothetical protein
MTAPSSCHAILELVGDNLDPDKLRKLFSIKPKLARRKGDEQGRRPGRPTAFARTGYCGFSTLAHVSSDNINDHLEFLINEITRNFDRIQAIVMADKLTWQMVCFFDLPPAGPKSILRNSVVARASQMGIGIEIDTGDDAVTFVVDGLPAGR